MRLVRPRHHVRRSRSGSGCWPSRVAARGSTARGAARQRSLALLRAREDPLLRASSADALRAGLVAMQQLSAISEVAATVQVPVLALNGAARLLGGESAGTRTMSDIDLLVGAEGAGGASCGSAGEVGIQSRRSMETRATSPSPDPPRGAARGDSPSFDRQRWVEHARAPDVERVAAGSRRCIDSNSGCRRRRSRSARPRPPAVKWCIERRGIVCAT